MEEIDTICSFDDEEIYSQTILHKIAKSTPL